MDTTEKTGAGDFKKPPTLKLNEIRLNGKTGEFIFNDLLGKKKDEKTPSREIGTTLSLRFLKIRRKMSYYSKTNEKFVTTSEHNSKYDTVFLFGPNVRGKAEDLRETYQSLRVQQIVYCIYEGELVRLIVRGASLGSQADDQGTKFYEYLKAFGENEHVHLFHTKIKSKSETGQLGDYYAMDFSRGEAVTKEEKKENDKMIDEVHDVTSKTDAYYNKQKEEDIVQHEVAGEVAPPNNEKVDYPTEDINPEDIPF